MIAKVSAAKRRIIFCTEVQRNVKPKVKVELSHRFDLENVIEKKCHYGIQSVAV